MKFMASSFASFVGSAVIWGDAFKNADYNAESIAPREHCYEFDPPEWEKQDLISYDDHGSTNWAGIHSGKIPLLDNSIVVNYACLTCSTYDSDSFCNLAIRQGALTHVGAVSVAFTGNPVFMNTMNGVYYNDLTLGEAFAKSYINERYKYMIMLLGDPTLDINPPKLLNKRLKSLEDFPEEYPYQ